MNFWLMNPTNLTFDVEGDIYANKLVAELWFLDVKNTSRHSQPKDINTSRIWMGMQNSEVNLFWRYTNDQQKVSAC